jgi:CheY-like chemotaxis protein
MKIIDKIFFYIKNPRIIIFSDNLTSDVLDISKKILKDLFPKKIFYYKEIENKEINFLINHSSSPILVVLDDKLSRSLMSKCLRRGFIITDYSNLKSIEKLKKNKRNSIKTVGFDEKSDIWASDLNFSAETNFKINHQGDVVPIWINRKISKKNIIEILIIAQVGIIMGLNLVEISQQLKN